MVVFPPPIPQPLVTSSSYAATVSYVGSFPDPCNGNVTTVKLEQILHILSPIEVTDFGIYIFCIPQPLKADCPIVVRFPSGKIIIVIPEQSSKA